MMHLLPIIFLFPTALLAHPDIQKCSSIPPSATSPASTSNIASITAPTNAPSSERAVPSGINTQLLSAIESGAVSKLEPVVTELLGVSKPSSAVDPVEIPEDAQREASQQEQDVLALFAAYSGAAYTVTDSWNCPYACQYPGTQGTIVEHRWNTGFPPSAGYIARNPNGRFLVVAFQGTDDISQWADNLNIAQTAWPTAIPGSRVHEGFLRGYTSVQDDVIGRLGSLASRYPDHSIAIVGHSLGGARAALCLVDVSIKLPALLPRVHLYTQGQPRTGNRAFADAVDALSVTKYREVYEYDAATRLPPTSMGYHHHSTETWYHRNETLLCVKPVVDDGCATSGDIFHPLSVPDHFGYPGLKYE